MLPLLGVLFLDHLLELVQFLAQLRKGLLYGIGFLSAFLSGAEIRFFRSVFLETTTIVSIVCRVRTPMLLAKVAVFLGTSFPRDSGTLPVPGRYVLLDICSSIRYLDHFYSYPLMPSMTRSGVLQVRAPKRFAL